MTGEETFHPDTRALLAYSRLLAGAGEAPRPTVSAGSAERLAGRLFVLDRAGVRLVVRTFGPELVALFGRDLRENDFDALLPPSERALFHAFVSAVAAAGLPGIVRLRAEARDGRFGAELLVTPLRTLAGSADRYLGMFQPLGGEPFAGGGVERLRIGSLHPPEAPEQPARPRLVVSNR